MAPIDHTNTMALLIGVSEFPEDREINAIPNVTTNINLLKATLINPELIGIAESNITISVNESKNKIERKLQDIAEKTRQQKFTLLIYYTGHGMLSPEDFQFYFSTYDTSHRYLRSDSINMNTFKSYVTRSLAGRKVLILDCCHSGALIAQGDLKSKIQAELNNFEGTYTITSSAEDMPSFFPINEPQQPTFFTGELLSIINGGIENGNQYCSLRDIFNEIELSFRHKGHPRPQQSIKNSADNLYISINKKFKAQPKPLNEVKLVVETEIIRTKIPWFTGCLAILFIPILILGAFVFGHRPYILNSIGEYYHTNMGTALIEIMSAISISLFFHKGDTLKEKQFSRTAGVFGIFMALFFTTESSRNSIIISTLHYFTTGIFFSILSYMSVFLYTKSFWISTPSVKLKNRIYRICGLTMSFSVIFIPIESIPAIHESIGFLKLTLLSQTSAYISFGISWLTKAGFILKDNSGLGV